LLKHWNQIVRHSFQTTNKKDYSAAAIFLISSIFSNRNPISLFSRKANDYLIKTTGKKIGVPELFSEL